MSAFDQEFQRVFELLLEENQALRKENNLLRETNSALEKKFIALEGKFTLLHKENNNLKEKLGLNSTNSSLPPSRDIYSVKRKNRSQSGRKPGGQPGHPGTTYKLLPPDKIIDCLPEICLCGHELEKVDRFVKEQKIEIPPIKPQVTEYRRWYGKCKTCKKTKLACLPQGVGADLLGNHAKAIICSLNGCYLNSKREVQAILKEIFSLNISLGLISDTTKRVNKHLAGHYENLRNQIMSSDYLHIDETGHKSKGKRGWAWVFTNKTSTLLHLDRSRGQKVILGMIGKYDGYVISDRYGAYNCFEESQRQICWSHLQRDFERFAHSRNASLALKGQRLVAISKKVFGLVSNFRKEQISKVKLSLRLDKFQKEIRAILESILKLPDTPKAQGITKNLLKSFSMMWRFLEEEAIKIEIGITNNLAERQIRKYVIYRKKLLFTWSNWGNEFVERILSLFLTSRLVHANPFNQLTTCINNTS